MATNKLKINLFGKNWKIKRLVLPEELLKKIMDAANKTRQPITVVIIDPFFYHSLQNKTIQSFEDLDGNTTEGLINSSKNQVEIWYKNKKIKKLKIDNLNEKLLLFPLYNATIQKVSFHLEKGFYVEQTEIGLIASFEIRTNEFNIDDLKFQLLQINELTLLEKVIYKDQVLINNKKDTLITFQNCYEKI